jgi:hypothetical protein
VIGQSNRGWNSYGNRAFGLQRLVWTGRTPLEVEKMEAVADGFRFTFTRALDAQSFAGAASFSGQSYTYKYHSTYGSPEVNAEPLRFPNATLSADRRSILLQCENRRAGYVHEIELPAVRSEDAQPLWHRAAYYTLNRLPEK